MADNASVQSDQPDEGEELDLSPGKGARDILKEEMEGAHKNLGKEVKKKKEEIISERTKEELDEYKGIRGFFEGIFGKTVLASFFIGVTSFISGEKGEFDPEVFKEEIDKQAAKAAGKDFDIEEYVVSHRSLGYGGSKENSKEALAETLTKGEKQIELDLRLGDDGQIYIVHDSIKGEKDLKGFMTLAEALSIIGSAQNQECVVTFDIKNQGILDKLDKAIDETDNQNRNNPNYRPISERHMVASFDKTILKEAFKRKRPLMFFYYPTCKYAGIQKVLNFIGVSGTRSVVDKIDFFTGQKAGKELEETDIKIEGKSLSDNKTKKEKSFEIWSELPSPDILRLIKSSDGYLVVPGSLATKELIDKAHGEGVKIALLQDGPEEVKEAIYSLEADLVISNTPDIVQDKPDEPVEMDLAA